MSKLNHYRYLSAMIHPGGGRNDIPEWLKKHSFVLNNTIPNDQAIDKIFATIVQGEIRMVFGFTPSSSPEIDVSMYVVHLSMEEGSVFSASVRDTLHFLLSARGERKFCMIYLILSI